MGDWARIHRKFGKNSNEVTERAILPNGDYKKMANLGEKGKLNFGKKMESSRLRPNTSEMTKRGIFTNNNFIKITIWQKFIKVWQKCKQDDKRGMSIIVGFTEMTYFAKLANLTEDTLQVKVWQKI